LTVTEQACQGLASAERDRDTVKILLAAPRQLYEIVAYQCQQYGEKCLKAVLVQFDRKLSFILDLLQLRSSLSGDRDAGA
jgi:HEPN domain-containing protein